jgi:hypothetical protein
VPGDGHGVLGGDGHGVSGGRLVRETRSTSDHGRRGFKLQPTRLLVIDRVVFNFHSSWFFVSCAHIDGYFHKWSLTQLSVEVGSFVCRGMGHGLLSTLKICSNFNMKK